MEAEANELRDWLVTATAACALAACVAGIVRPFPTLPDPDSPPAQPERRTAWVRLSAPSGTHAGEAVSAPTPPAPADVPATPAPLAQPGPAADLPDLPALPVPRSTGAAAGAAAVASASPSGGSAATRGADSPVRLERAQLGGRQPWPDYPAAALRRREEGTVTMRLSVDPSGAVREVRVTGSSGWRSLDEAAADTIRRRWSFPPGEPRDYLVDIRFQIL